MKRSRIAAMSLIFSATVYSALAQVSTSGAGSTQSAKSQVKDKKGATSSATESRQHPIDITASGKTFLSGCSSIDKPADQLNSYETHSNVQCLSYVDGIFEAMSLVDDLHLKPSTFCEPERPVQRKELVQIAQKYIAERPGTINERTVMLVWLAFTKAFPCPEEKK
jgi:hypothetical protein